MVNLRNIIIETERLRLAPIEMKHAPSIFSEFTEEITTYMFPAAAKNITETENFVRQELEKIRKGESLTVIITDKTGGGFLGVESAVDIHKKIICFGIWLKKSAHGNKYGQEAMKGLKDWIDNNIKYEYIFYPVDKRNVASRKVAESLGGVIRAKYKKKNMSGNILDEVEYRIYPIP